MEKKNYLFDNKTLVALLIPLIIEQMLAVLVGMADSIMIASVGEAAVSGVSLVDQIMILVINIFAALATGGAVVVGQFLGQKRKEDARSASQQLISFISLCSIIIMVLLYGMKNIMLHGIFGNIEPDVMNHANKYYMIVIASTPFIALYNSGAAVFRAMGNSKTPMTISLVMNIINVTGNAICIYGFGLGTEGVAIPTLISRIVSAFAIVILLSNPKHILYLEKRKVFHWNKHMIWKILRIGVPNGLENSMFQLGRILVLSLVSTLGTYAITANAVANVIAQVQMLPAMALSLAVTTIIARCVGAGDNQQVHYYTKKLILLTMLLQVVCNGIVFASLPTILKIYQLSKVTAETVGFIVIFYGIMTVIIWPFSFTLPGTLRCAGDVKMVLITSVLSMWVCRIVLSYVFVLGFKMGVIGVWIAMILDWVVRSVCFIIRYRSGKWKRQSKINGC